jgi:porin
MYDWSPPNINRNNTLFTASTSHCLCRFITLCRSATCKNRLSQQFVPPRAPAWKPEHAVEFNALLDPLPMLLLQPVIQYYANVGCGSHHAVVFGFRTKVEF